MVEEKEGYLNEKASALVMIIAPVMALGADCRVGKLLSELTEQTLAHEIEPPPRAPAVGQRVPAIPGSTRPKEAQ